MNQPTKEQKQWFWEQCGLISFTDDIGVVYEYERKLHKEPPPIDLNNLFKYAVPKLDVYNHGGFFFNLVADGERWVCRIDRKREATINSFYHLDGYGEDPALALFWAIYKALGGK